MHDRPSSTIRSPLQGSATSLGSSSTSRPTRATRVKATARSPTLTAGPSTSARSPSSWRKWWVCWPFTCSSRSTANYGPSPAPSSSKNLPSAAYPRTATASGVAPACAPRRPPAETPRPWGRAATRGRRPPKCPCTR